MVDETARDAIDSGLDDLLAIGGPLRALVDEYLSEEQPRFAGRLFDRLPNNNPDAFTADDLVALATLNVEVDYVAVEALLGSGRDRYNELLAAIPTGVDVLDAAQDYGATQDALARAGDLWSALKNGVDGVGWVRAHKLVARKRPRLHPVYDQVVQRWFAPSDGIRYGLAALVADSRDVAGELRAALDPDGTTGLGVLRLLDIAVWMCGATQEAAVEARRRHRPDVPPERVFPAD